MVFYVLIRKRSESGSSRIYEFGPGDDRLGELTFDMLTGESTLLRPVPPAPEDKPYFSAAAFKLSKHWKEGLVPDRTAFVA